MLALSKTTLGLAAGTMNGADERARHNMRSESLSKTAKSHDSFAAMIKRDRKTGAVT
jgi:hypothetical protein